MRYGIALLTSLFVLAPPSLSHAEVARFTGVLEIQASVGVSVDSFQLLSVDVAGAADIDGGVVRIDAGEFSAVVPNASGFGGTLINGPATFSAAGAGSGSSCPLIGMQEICIDGGAFGGVMALGGVTHEGQALSVWGLGGTHTGSTASGISRAEEGTRWTEGNASAWYYVLEIDPATPFLLSGVGTFRGLPGTFAAVELPGFSLVTPMVVTADLPTSSKNVRAVAMLRVDFDAKPVPTGGAGILAILLVSAGMARLRLTRRSAAEEH
jgi:hypothetical protein